MPEKTDAVTQLLAHHRESKAIERSNAGKVIRKVARELKARGFVRKSNFFSRERGHIVQFVHVHKFSFGPCFRVHVGVRVLNDSKSHMVLNGISSDEHPHYRTAIEFDQGEESLNTCAQQMLSYISEVAEPWFDQQTCHALLSDNTPLYPGEREALAAALRGESDEKNVLLSRSLLGT